MGKINKNSVSLAGEFAVLSQLALRDYNANMTLGNTKGVDILVSDPRTNKMYQLEVKTNFKNSRNKPSVSKIHGKAVSAWIMKEENGKTENPNLFYCFVNISKDTNSFKYYIIPSKVVAKYIREECDLWIKVKTKQGDKFKITEMRNFRLGVADEKYPIETPIAEQYENNWDFKQ
jgi:hypothetical protein